MFFITTSSWERSRARRAKQCSGFSKSSSSVATGRLFHSGSCTNFSHIALSCKRPNPKTFVSLSGSHTTFLTTPVMHLVLILCAINCSKPAPSILIACHWEHARIYTHLLQVAWEGSPNFLFPAGQAGKHAVLAVAEQTLDILQALHVCINVCAIWHELRHFDGHPGRTQPS